jgi:hypothetical protein
LTGLQRRTVFLVLAGAFWLLAAVRLVWLYRATGGVIGWDYGIYTEAAGRAAAGLDIYSHGEIGTGFINHPGFLLLVYPFLWAGRAGFWIWSALSLAAWPQTIRLAAVELRKRRALLFLLPLTAAAEALFMGQASIPAALCLAAAYAAVRKDRDVLAGFFIGVGVLLKFSLAIFGLYFLLRRRFRAAAALGATVAVFSLAAEWLLYPGINRMFLLTMVDLYADHHTGVFNSSLAGMPFFPFLAIILLAALSLAVVRNTAPSTEWLAFGGLAAWTLVVSPLTWHHHFVLLAVPLAGLLHDRPWFGIALVALIQVDLLGFLAGLPVHTGLLAALGILILALIPLTGRPGVLRDLRGEI